MNASLFQPCTQEEVDRALAQMHPHKPPGPDGMNSFFFQKFWDIIGNDVSVAVLEILHGHPIPPTVKHTLVALVPKNQRPEVISEFRPISLCHVVYKLVIKVIANHLKPLLPYIIFETQGTFVQGHFISNNILIVFEISMQ